MKDLKTYTQEELNEILENHKKWLKGNNQGNRANLIGADLSGADLKGADLTRANLYEADLSKADLSRTDLTRANLCRADLIGADLSGADLYGAILIEADLRGADLREAYLMGADLRGAKNVPFIPMACPDEGEFIGWKKAHVGKHEVLVKLKILEDSKRSSATGRKCRTDKALVLSIIDLKENKECSEAISYYDNHFKYTVGEIVSVPDFDDDRFNECAPGIHFFINKEEALNY